MKNIRIGVTCIGSGVGQSIVDSLKTSNLDTHIIGFGMNPYAFGAYDCDENISLPSIYADGYINQLLSACIEARLDILLPGHDDELLLLSDHIEKFNASGIQVPVSQRPLLELCRDKTKMSFELNDKTHHYVNSYSRDQIIAGQIDDSTLYPLIAKPNAGFASRGLSIVRNRDDIAALDDNMVLQEIALPHPNSHEYKHFVTALESNQVLQLDELSLQVIIGKDGNELGRFASRNKLHNGVPIEIVPVKTPEAWAAIDNVLPQLIALGLRGPINFQGRLTEHGPKFFEMNARFTGITGLRAMCGFNEVEAIVRDALALDTPPTKLGQNYRKIGVRQYKNRAIDFKENYALEQAVINGGDVSATPGLTILVTGANSYLGRATLDALLKNKDVGRIIGLVRQIERFNNVDSPKLPSGIEVYPLSSFYDGTLNFGEVDIVCHLASSRPVHTHHEIAESLTFTQHLVNSAIKHQTAGFIYASSQSVYGTKQKPLWHEAQAPAPETAYAMAKYSSELLLKQISTLNPMCHTTSLRISRLFGPSPVFRQDELPHKFIASALNNQALTVMGGPQKMDFIDVRDAASVISTLISTPRARWLPVLNVSSGTPTSVLELAQLALSVAGHKAPYTQWIKQNLTFSAPDFGMDISYLSEKFNWQATFDIRATLSAIAHQLSSKPAAAKTSNQPDKSPVHVHQACGDSPFAKPSPDHDAAPFQPKL